MKRAGSGTASRRFAARGFTLVELAMMLMIVGLVLGSMLYTLSAQVEQSNRAETQRRLEYAKELVLAFAIVNGRLPCPARSNSLGREVRRDEDDVPPVAPANDDYGKCKDDVVAVEDYYGGSLPVYVPSATGGLLPAISIGFQPVDDKGFAVDAWGNRIRYAVARTAEYTVTCPRPSIPPPPDTPPHFTHTTNLKTGGLSCRPSDLIVCNVSQVIAPGGACAPTSAVTNEKTIVALVFSTGKNGQSPPQGANEIENVNGGGNVNPVFVSRAPDPAGAASGEFDDIVVWIPIGLLYGRMVAAGVLP